MGVGLGAFALIFCIERFWTRPVLAVDQSVTVALIGCLDTGQSHQTQVKQNNSYRTENKDHDITNKSDNFVWDDKCNSTITEAALNAFQNENGNILEKMRVTTRSKVYR